MASLISAGLLMCRWCGKDMEYFLVHPGGPYFLNRESGVWSIPKGLPEGEEDLLHTAQREFTEETGIISKPPYYSLGAIVQKGGKTVHAWTFLGEWDAAQGIQCNSFTIEWPPRSGKFQSFPEQDKAAWMSIDQASMAIIQEQRPFLNRATIIHKEAAVNQPPDSNK